MPSWVSLNPYEFQDFSKNQQSDLKEKRKKSTLYNPHPPPLHVPKFLPKVTIYLIYDAGSEGNSKFKSTIRPGGSAAGQGSIVITHFPLLAVLLSGSVLLPHF